MSLFADILNSVFDRRALFVRPRERDGRPVEALAEALVEADGEESGRALARQILDRFDEMGDGQKRAFFAYLVSSMNIAPQAVRDTLTEYETAPSGKTYRAFMAAAEPPRQELVRRLNSVPGATGQLVRMRADLLRLMRDDPSLSPLDVDFRHLFSSWFNRGFLVLRPISWESPAHILEKIIAYEAVHAIHSWDDLRRRLEPQDRRCFAFFHPAMPDEPLVFVEVALTSDIPGSIQGLLAENRAETQAREATTAVFYSISNCQTGLDGISFGNSLIKQVAADLSLELPGLDTFVTLSPIPGLARWLETTQPRREAVEKPELLPALTAWYLLEAKRADGSPLDPVARFHLRNGAEVFRVHAGADTSEKGMRQSKGMMVNYLYKLDKVAANHEGYAADRSVAASAQVRSLSAAAEKACAPETLL